MSLPVNRPRVPVHDYQRDGTMRFGENGGCSVNYEPNGLGEPVEDHAFNEPPLPVSGAADRYDHGIGNDDYSQPGALFRLTSKDQRQLFDNIAAATRGVPEAIQPC